MPKTDQHSTRAPQPFRFLKQFNAPPFEKKIACRDRLRESDARWFPGEFLSSVFARALCARRAVPFKEVLESFEFYACVRKQIRSASLADLCCGHGMVGIVFAMFERRVERVTLLDKVCPRSFDAVLSAANEVAPWVADKVEYVTCSLEQAEHHLGDGDAVLGVHACGERTDICINHAIRVGGPTALLPCCHDYHPFPSPACVKQELGGDVAIDVHRTYRMFNAGYHVRWGRIPDAITPMNRVLVGNPPRMHTKDV